MDNHANSLKPILILRIELCFNQTTSLFNLSLQIINQGTISFNFQSIYSENIILILFIVIFINEYFFL